MRFLAIVLAVILLAGIAEADVCNQILYDTEECSRCCQDNEGAKHPVRIDQYCRCLFPDSGDYSQSDDANLSVAQGQGEEWRELHIDRNADVASVASHDPFSPNGGNRWGWQRHLDQVQDPSHGSNDPIRFPAPYYRHHEGDQETRRRHVYADPLWTGSGLDFNSGMHVGSSGEIPGAHRPRNRRNRRNRVDDVRSASHGGDGGSQSHRRAGDLEYGEQQFSYGHETIPPYYGGTNGQDGQGSSGYYGDNMGGEQNDQDTYNGTDGSWSGRWP